MIELEMLKKLALYGSPTARAAALTILDQMTNGRITKELKKILDQ